MKYEAPKMTVSTSLRYNCFLVTFNLEYFADMAIFPSKSVLVLRHGQL